MTSGSGLISDVGSSSDMSIISGEVTEIIFIPVMNILYLGGTGDIGMRLRLKWRTSLCASIQKCLRASCCSLRAIRQVLKAVHSYMMVGISGIFDEMLKDFVLYERITYICKNDSIRFSLRVC